MKKKILLAIALSTCGASTLVHAGGMGPVKKPLPVLVPFLAGEAMYTWPDIAGYNVRILNVDSAGNDAVITSKNTNDGWGGRFAAGAMHPFSERFAGSAELGYGYYGKVDANPIVTVSSGVRVIPAGTSMKMVIHQYGMDVLAGVVYNQPKYDLFFKVGGLVQNLKLKTDFNPTVLSGGRVNSITQRLNGQYSLNQTLVNVLPMLRLGGGYHVTKNWLATVSWMHAFGATLKLTAPNIEVGGTGNVGSFGDVEVKMASPTLNTVMFGTEYRFDT